ncbi:hypothetical protein Ddc_19979 [Ditylenchus destructor]|nr:hypothetical protein Ddc_19979 [Ditylenchus destructor]
MSQICEDAKTKAGLNRLPPANVTCEMSSHKIDLEVLKFINVYEEKQIIRGKNGDEKVFELRVTSLKWDPTKDGAKKVKGSLIWETLGLNDSDILHTHKDPSKGKMITFDSSEEFVIENLHILYVSKKDETTKKEEKNQN